MGSYYTHFNREWPELKLAEHHPYIRSRFEQQRQGFEVAGADLRLMFLELPFIFGSVPGRKPLWTPLIAYLNSKMPSFCPDGGTSVVSVKTVAAAAVAALIRGEARGCYPIGEENMTWGQLFRKLSDSREPKPTMHHLPAWLVRFAMRMARIQHLMQGRESGLDYRYLPEILLNQTFLDAQASAVQLGYGNRGIEDAFKETIRASGYV
jgi:hypothetical protein